jgi:hypothetical protein
MDGLHLSSDGIVRQAAEDGIAEANLAFAKRQLWVLPEIEAAAAEAFTRAFSVGDDTNDGFAFRHAGQLIGVDRRFAHKLEAAFKRAFVERLCDLEWDV